ncbi:hypothetical protein LMG33818_000032 [Halomonadaceae bacterium LMG 33818]
MLFIAFFALLCGYPDIALYACFMNFVMTID